jgi:uncharacterized protein YbaR (Trm112 family)
MQVSADSLIDLLSIIAEPGTYGTREEWLYYFERTKATNAPGMLFSDACRAGILIEEIPGTYCFVIDTEINQSSYPIKQEEPSVITPPKRSRSLFSKLIRKGLTP